MESRALRFVDPDADYLLLLATVTGRGYFWVSGRDGTIIVGGEDNEYYIYPESDEQKRGWEIVLDSLRQKRFVEGFASKGGYNLYRVTPDGQHRAETFLEVWAQHHNVKNRYNMGPRNWERCKYDLKLPGGANHCLEYDDDGYLHYQ